jgi:hypothetical protein
MRKLQGTPPAQLEKWKKILGKVGQDDLKQPAVALSRQEHWANFESRCLRSAAKLDGRHFSRIEFSER